MVEVIYRSIDGKEFSSEELAKAHEMKNWSSRVITFWGSSDDLIMIDDGENVDEIYMGDDIEVYTPSGNMLITPIYDGSWTFAVGLLNEDPFPNNVKITHAREHEYSLRVSLSLPDGSIVKVCQEEPKYF